MRNLLAAFAKNTVFANIVLMMIIVSGLMAVYNMVCETFPVFSLDMVTVTVPWPGADPEDVEESIVQRIEEKIKGIDGIRQFNSTSAEHVGTVMVEVAKGYEVDYVKEKVRNEVESISTFPLDAEEPVVEELLLRDPVLNLALYGDDMDERGLKEWAERLKEELRRLPGVSQVQVGGARKYEIAIEVSEVRLREYGLSFEQVSNLVRANSLNLSAGTIRTEGEDIRLRTIGRRYTGADFAKIVVKTTPDGEKITLDRIATIIDGFTEDSLIPRFNGQQAVNINVLKTPDENTLAIEQAVRDYIEIKEQELPEGLHIAVWGSISHILSARINLLLRNGAIGIVLVFIVLWIFLDLRLSFWAGMGMPISVMGALMIMWAVGATINMISLFGLIMVLGIIVDDAIVVGEAIYVARKAGKPPLRAAVDGVSEVGLPVVGAVTTSIVAFLPLMFVDGIMGKFIAVLPVVVIACLLISLVECLIMLPAHLSHLPDPNAPVKTRNAFIRFGRRFHSFTNNGLERFVDRYYLPFITGLLHWRYVALATAIAVLFFAVGLVQGGVLKFVMFPDVDGDEMRATVEFPNGTPLDVTQDAIERIEQAIYRIADQTETRSGDPLIKNLYSLVGGTIEDGAQPRYGNHLGSVQVEMLTSEHRGILLEELEVMWEEEVGKIPGTVSLTYMARAMGPPGAPIEIWVQGNKANMDEIIASAEALCDKLESYEGIYQVEHDFRLGKNEMRLRLKPEARPLGITVSDLASQVNAGYFGAEAIRIQRGRDDIRVRVRYPIKERREMSDFEQIRIRTKLGTEVPLLSVADIEYGPGMATIQRTDGMRRVAVTAQVDTGKANTQEVLMDLEQNFFDQLKQQNTHIAISVEGEQKKTFESISSLLVTYPLALLGIFVIVATIFRSYIQPVIIMVTVPFGIIGAIFGHILLGYNLSMLSFFGMVALSGVVVNDAIVLIERINNFLAEGLPFYESVCRGGARRFRAIFLTSVSTVGGLTPLMMEQDLQARFLIPMAISIAAGVAFATLLTLLLIPCLLCIMNDFRRLWFRLRKGYWPTREEVEPARKRLTETLEGTIEIPTPPKEIVLK